MDPSAYPLASMGYANYMLRHYGYKSVFIFGLTLYGIGALCMWPAGLNRSFGGFCAATFVIGSGLGSLETAANPYLAGRLQSHIRFTMNPRLREAQSAVPPSTPKSESTSPRRSTASAPALPPFWHRSSSSLTPRTTSMP